MNKSALPGGNGALEDTINTLLLQGTAQTHIMAELIRLLTQFTGNGDMLVIDSDGDGQVDGLVIGDAQMIEHMATLGEVEGWDCSTIRQAITSGDTHSTEHYPFRADELN